MIYTQIVDQRTLHFAQSDCVLSALGARLPLRPSRSLSLLPTHPLVFQTNRCRAKHSRYSFGGLIPLCLPLPLLIPPSIAPQPVQMSAFTSSAIKGSSVAAGSTQTWLLLSHHTTSHTHTKKKREARRETFARGGSGEQTKTCMLGFGGVQDLAQLWVRCCN